MTSYADGLHDFCRTYAFRSSVIESSLALWQEYPGMKIDTPLANPPHSVALYGNGSWEVLFKTNLSLINRDYHYRDKKISSSRCKRWIHNIL